MPGSSTSGSWARTFASRPRTPPGFASSEKRSERSRSQTRQGSPTQRRRGIVRRASRTARLRVAVDDAGRTVLEPDRPSVDGAVAALLGILHEAQLTGQWRRLKGVGSAAMRSLTAPRTARRCVVRDADLRQPDQEPRLPATPLLHHDQSMTTMDATASSRRGVVEAPAQWRASLCRGAENGLPTRQWLPRTDLTQETSWGAVTATANDRRSCRPCHLRATSSGHQRSAADGQGHSERAVRLGWLVWGSRAANWSQRGSRTDGGRAGTGPSDDWLGVREQALGCRSERGCGCRLRSGRGR